MAQPIIQPSFAAGELAPSMFARVDFAKFHVGAALLRNMFVDYRGGASNRPGTIWVGRCKAGGTSDIVRNIPFIFSTLQAYALEFGHRYMRPIMNGGYVLEPAINLNALTIPNPVTLTATSLAFANGNLANGDWVFITGETGMTQLNDKVYIVKNVDIPSKKFALTDLDGVDVDASAWSTYAGGGTVARLATFVTPYNDTDLELVKYSQSADVMTLTHTGYETQQLTRSAHYTWTMANATFASAVPAPAGVAVATSPGAGATAYNYVVTAVDSRGRESVASTSAGTLVAATMSSTAGSYNTVTWGAVVGSIYYNVYRQREVPGAAPSAGEIYGFVGTTTAAALTDHNINPDFSATPPISNNPLTGAGNRPGCTAYFQQRQTFAGSVNGPQTIWMTKSGDFLNMDYSIPTRDDDSITQTIASQQMNAIKHLVPMNSLIALTAGGAWRIDGGSSSDTITPTKFVATPQSFNGCSDVRPIVVNYDVLYVQSKGSTVRDLAYNFYVNVYTGVDLSMLSNHLFKGRRITEWAYAEEPFHLIQCIRDDGIMLTLTFLKEQEVFAWARSDTLGRFKSICSIPEGNEDAVYLVVERKMNGRTIKCQERMASRLFEDNMMGDATTIPWFVDCGLSYPLTYPAAAVTPEAGWGDGITVEADAAVFSSAMVGNTMQLNGGTATVATYVSPTEVTVNWRYPARHVFSCEEGSWSCTAPTGRVTGLDHLNGMDVVALVDGNVVTDLTVSELEPGVFGVDLPEEGTSIVVGLPFQSQFKSLYLDVRGEVPTSQGKRWNVPACTIRLSASRGIKVGTSFETPSRLREAKERSVAPYFLPAPLGDTVNVSPIRMVTSAGDPIPLITGDERIGVDQGWDVDPQICVQQDNPLPFTILGMIPEVVLGDTPQ